MALQGLWWYRFRILDKAWLYSTFWSALGTLCLYTPVLLLQGPALWGNAWVMPLSEAAWWQHLPDFLYAQAAFFWGDGLWGLGLSVGALLLVLRQKSFRILVGLLFVLLVLLYVQKLLPPARVFTWVSVALALGYAAGLHRFQTYKKGLLWLLLPLLLALQVYNHSQYYALQGEYRSVTEVLQKLPAKPCRIATASDVYLTFIRLEAIEKNYAWQTYSNTETESDLLLLAPSEAAPGAYFLCYQDEFVSLWQKGD